MGTRICIPMPIDYRWSSKKNTTLVSTISFYSSFELEFVDECHRKPSRHWLTGKARRSAPRIVGRAVPLKLLKEQRRESSTNSQVHAIAPAKLSKCFLKAQLEEEAHADASVCPARRCKASYTVLPSTFPLNEFHASILHHTWTCDSE